MVTQQQLAKAVADSVTEGELVTVEIGPEEDMAEVYEELCDLPFVATYRHEDYSHTLRQVAGTTRDGETWHVNLQQREYAPGDARRHGHGG